MAGQPSRRSADLDLDRGELRIKGQLQQGRRKRGKTKKAHRTVPLPAVIVALLQWHLKNQDEERRIAHHDWNKTGLVFCSEVGTPLSGHNVWRQFTALQRRVGLAEVCTICAGAGTDGGEECVECHGYGVIALFRVHDLRHTYAALAIAAGVDIFTLSRRMGHESITTTADKYGHLYTGQTDDAQAIARLLRRAE